MKSIHSLLIIVLICAGCAESVETKSKAPSEEKATIREPKKAAPAYTLEAAEKLLELPLHCVTTEYPNKLGQTIGDDEDLKPPRTLHPIFYGCFDWHSAVHGYWSMVTLVKRFPELEKANEVRELLESTITMEKVAAEVSYFEGELNGSYERTYGWAWLLKLSEALKTWDDPLGQELTQTLQPLTDVIVSKYIEFLPKLVYPIRVGEHTNTAFGLTFAYDYAIAFEHNELKALIESRAKSFFTNDAQCPLSWEPSGYDFLSPCLEEIDMMRRVLDKAEFSDWIHEFMPALADSNFTLAAGVVSDRTDGKLVHLDGLNFSRAWVFYGLANQYPEFAHLKQVAHNHVGYSYPNLVGDNYEGGHWLGSFAIYALETYQNQ